MQEDYEIFNKELMFMLWAYDLEFFTLKHASDSFGYALNKIGERVVYPLDKEGTYTNTSISSPHPPLERTTCLEKRLIVAF